MEVESILSDSQAMIKAVDNHLITTKLIWDCHQSLMQLVNITEFS
jgi:hypothetical protein